MQPHTSPSLAPSFSFSFLPSALSTLAARHHKPTAEPWDTHQSTEGGRQGAAMHAAPSLTFNPTITHLSNKHSRLNIHSTHTGEISHYVTDSRIHSANIYTPMQTPKVWWKVKPYTGTNIHNCTETRFFQFPATYICIEKNLSLEIKDKESTKLMKKERADGKKVCWCTSLTKCSCRWTDRAFSYWDMDTLSSILLTPTHTLTCVSHSKQRCANQRPTTQCDWQLAL